MEVVRVIHPLVAYGLAGNDTCAVKGELPPTYDIPVSRDEYIKLLNWMFKNCDVDEKKFYDDICKGRETKEQK